MSDPNSGTAVCGDMPDDIGGFAAYRKARTAIQTLQVPIGGTCSGAMVSMISSVWPLIFKM